jgi:hypothetical protein
MPGARCTRGLVCKEVVRRTRAYRAAESIRHSLRKGLREAEKSCAIKGIDFLCPPLCPGENFGLGRVPCAPMSWRAFDGPACCAGCACPLSCSPALAARCRPFFGPRREPVVAPAPCLLAVLESVSLLRDSLIRSLHFAGVHKGRSHAGQPAVQ